jgi:hypothetical protein
MSASKTHVTVSFRHVLSVSERDATRIVDAIGGHSRTRHSLSWGLGLLLPVPLITWLLIVGGWAVSLAFAWLPLLLMLVVGVGLLITASRQHGIRVKPGVLTAGQSGHQIKLLG